MTISDLDCIQSCCDTYKNPGAFDDWFDGSKTDEVVCGVKLLNEVSLVAFRGSTVFLDWIRDFNAAMVQTAIGSVEAGFYIGQHAVFAQVTPLLPKDKPVHVTGHSLGGGRAHLFAALLIQAGYNVSVTVFGSPRPGDAVLTGILTPFPNSAYKNGPDYVTDVPIPIHPLLPYEHPGPWRMVSAPPPEDDAWGLLAWHHSELYLAAIKQGACSG